MSAISFLCAVALVTSGYHTNAKMFDYALNKTTWSVDSKTGYADTSGDPFLVVDGNKSSCMTSSLQPYPWLAVDLGQDMKSALVYVSGAIVKNGQETVDWSVALGPVAPPDIISGADLAKEPFGQVTSNSYKNVEVKYFVVRCNPCPRGRYMYLYANWSTPSTIQPCIMQVAGEALDPCHGDFGYFPNQHVIGGEHQSNIATSDECKTACLDNDGCTSFDWELTTGEDGYGACC